MPKAQRQNFLQGAMILSGAVLIVKILGAIYKIPLANMIGEIGMSAFNTAYQLYLPVYTIAAAGLPAAVARAVSARCAVGDLPGARRVLRKILPVLLLTGAAGTLLMLLGASYYAAMVGNPSAADSVRVLAPTVLCCCAMSALRGYYAGLQNMTPTALSQILEAVGRLLLGLGGARRMLMRCRTEYVRYGTVMGTRCADESEAVCAASAWASAGAIFGVSAGALLGLLALIWYDRRFRPTVGALACGKAVTVWPILRSALPVCAGALMINLCGVLDTMLLQTQLRRVPAVLLRARFDSLTVPDAELPSFLYGSFCMAQNLAAFVPTMAQAIGTSALSTVSYAATRGTSALRDAVEEVLRLTALVAFPAGLGLSAIAEPALLLLYGARPEGARAAVPSLVVLGISSVFVTLSVPVNSMLQAVGRADIPVKLLGLGFGVKLAANLLLISYPPLNLLGACLGTLLCYALVAVVGLCALVRHCTARIRVGRCLRGALAAGVASAWVAWSVAECGKSLSPMQRVLLAVAAAVGVNAVVLCLGRVLCRKDVEMLPGGKKMAERLANRGWIR